MVEFSCIRSLPRASTSAPPLGSCSIFYVWVVDGQAWSWEIYCEKDLIIKLNIVGIKTVKKKHVSQIGSSPQVVEFRKCLKHLGSKDNQQKVPEIGKTHQEGLRLYHTIPMFNRK